MTNAHRIVARQANTGCGCARNQRCEQAGAPQVVMPQIYDQYYWAERVRSLGIGAAHAPGTPTTESLKIALERALQTEVATRARSIASAVRSDGALVAAQHVLRS